MHRSRSSFRVLLLFSLTASACRDATPLPRENAAAPRLSGAVLDGASSQAPALGSSAPSPEGAMAPLAAEWIERLELPGGGLAYVTPPVGSTEVRPLVVAVHGAIDDAGLICSAWRLIADAYPFVLCPAGSKVRKDTYVWPSSEAIGTAVRHALVALRARFGDRVASGPAIYVGFSQGANLAGPVLGSTGTGASFSRAVLTEGGYRGFDAKTARAFVKGGGDRVLFTCSQTGCATWFGGARAALDGAGATTRLAYAGAHGHSMVPAVRDSIHDALPWVVEGLDGWTSYATAPRLDRK